MIKLKITRRKVMNEFKLEMTYLEQVVLTGMLEREIKNDKKVIIEMEKDDFYINEAKNVLASMKYLMIQKEQMLTKIIKLEEETK
jgi:replicative DNA helicase